MPFLVLTVSQHFLSFGRLEDRFKGKLREMTSESFELEHLIGQSGCHPNTLHYLKNDDDLVVRAIGAMVVVASLSDP